jgi:tetratricopeptide (TPR) repeat protein
MVQANALIGERDYKGAFKLYEASCKTFASLDDLAGYVNCKLNMGLAYLHLDKVKEAKGEISEAEKIAQEFLLSPSLGKVYTNLALFSIKEKNWDQALDYLGKSLRQLRNAEGEAEYVYKSLSYQGFAQLEKGDLAASEKSFKEALDTKNENTKSYVLINLARLYLKKGNPDLALEKAVGALEIDKEETRSSYMAYDYFYISRIYLQKKDLTKSILYAKRGLHLSLATGNLGQSRKLTDLLMELYKEKNEPEQMEYYKKLQAKFK